MKCFANIHHRNGQLLRTLLLLSFISRSLAKGIAVIGASGGGKDEVCAECGGNYTDEEMEFALIILGVIMCVFFIILCCQCFSRVMWEFSEKSEQFVANNHYKRMPPPAYIRNKGNNV